MQSYHYQTLLILLVNLCSGLSASVINPFVDSIVMNFGMVETRNETGYYAGLLSASYMLARTVCSPIWGVLVDRIGRRVCVIVNLLGILFSTSTFPFVSSFWQAILLRIMLGALSSSPVACRATATEACPPEYQPKALLFYSMGFNIGMISGSSIGGILLSPSLQPDVRLESQCERVPY
jgi:MFS family permease